MAVPFHGPARLSGLAQEIASRFPALTEQLLPAATFDSASFHAFFPRSYDEPFVTEGEGIRVAVRAPGAFNAPAAEEDGRLAFRNSFPETDSLFVVQRDRAEEFLYLRSESAPVRFEYEIVELKGTKRPFLHEGAVRFVSAHGRGLEIGKPWIMDARGKRSEKAARWELKESSGAWRLALVVNPSGLSYPLLVDTGWMTAGALAEARIFHTATLLPNGKVLVAGGVNSGGLLSSAELYDPSTGTFSATGSLNSARACHTATLLPSGKVLIAGGISDPNTPLSSAELYDPNSGTFAITGSLVAARGNHSATLLPNGKVLLAGGVSSGDYAQSSAELYDPSTGTFSATGALTTARASYAATLLPSGKVLITGGWQGHDGETTLGSAELYDPAAGTFSAISPLAGPRDNHIATLLPNGKVLIAGGYNGSAATNSAELYDPATGVFSATGSLASARDSFSATLLPSGRVFVAGGRNGDACVGSAELYDPDSGSFSGAGSLATASYYHTATLLASGKVLVVGGGDNPANPTSSLSRSEAYDSAAGAFSATAASLAAGRAAHTATLLSDGMVLMAGGWGASGDLNSAELYDPATGTFAATGSLITARDSHTATLLPNGKVLIVGGYSDPDFVSSAELYDPNTGTFTATGSLAVARACHTATLLQNGMVLVAGGFNDGGTLDSAELYNPVTGTFTATGSLVTARDTHTATLLQNGKVLLAGGENADGILDSADIYDPATGTFSATGTLTSAHYYHTATLLPNGQVLVAAGWSGSSGETDIAELYDPATGTFSATGSLIKARYMHAARLLPDGKVLLAAGFYGGGALASAEIYDPASGTFADAGSLSTARYLQTATLLPNGEVLLAGGFDSASNSLSSAELYGEGLGYLDSWRPSIGSVSSPVVPGFKVTVSGTLFTGLNGMGPECSGGNTQSSATNYPLLQLRSLDSEETLFLPLDPAAGFSATSFTSSAAWSLSPGPALATVFTNGIPSKSKMVFSAQAGSVFPVPYSVTPLKITTTDHGLNGTIKWDASDCPSDGYHIVYGYGSGLSSWNVAGGACGLGTAGTATWSNIPNPSSDPSHFLWFLVVGDNGGNREGSWGTTSSGRERGNGPSGVCNMTTQASGECGTY
jgi:hypothetical protein